MRITFFCLLLVLCSINVDAQRDCNCYERLVHLSSYYDAIENYSDANESLLKALSYKENSKWDRLDYRRLALSYAKIEDYANTEKYLAKAITTGYSLASIQEFGDLELFKETEYWTQLVAKSDSLRKVYQANLNLDYRLAIEDITGSDQAIRSFMVRMIPDSVFAHVDSINFYRLKDLIDVYGFPNQQQHGFAEVELFHFFLHASMYSEQMQSDIIELLYAAQEKGLISKMRIALIQDRRDVWKYEKPQSLGLWNSWEDKTTFSEIRDLSTVDERRFEFNLLSLNEQAKIDGRALPDEYNQSTYPTGYFCGFPFTK